MNPKDPNIKENKNPAQAGGFRLNSRFILPIMMVYLMATLAADVVAYKWVTLGPLVESGATLLFPITYLLSDVVTEIYGYDMARKFIWLNLTCELIFALLVVAIIHMHSPAFLHNQIYFNHALGNTLRFVCAGVVANLASDFLNIYLISKWKIFMKGKHFWLRSVASTSISELFLVVVPGLLSFAGTMPMDHIVKMMSSAYLLELFYAFIFVWPGWMLILFLKKAEGIDAYDHDINYSPFRF